MEYFLVCPTCQTSYGSGRLGLRAPVTGETLHVTVTCLECRSCFDASVAWEIVQPRWYRRFTKTLPPSLRIATATRL